MSAIGYRRDQHSILLRNEAIGQLVFVVGLAWKMIGEDLAAARDRLAKGIAGDARLYSRCESIYHFVPGAGVDFYVDAAVGENFDAVFEERHENQDSGVILGMVQALFGK